MKAKRGLASAAAIAALSVGILTGCTPTVALTPAGAATNAKCASVVVLLPDTVSTLAKRQTDAQGTGAWGTPADIVLKCGVPVPDPTPKFPCVTVDGIDWLRNDAHAPVYIFTTFGRDPAVQVEINSADVKADGNQALTDLAIPVAEIPAKHHCVAPSEVLEDGEPVSIPTPTPTPTPTVTPTKKP